MPEEKKRDYAEQEPERRQASRVKGEVLQRILDRIGTVVWVAVVEVEASGGAAENLRWDLRSISCSEKLGQWLGRGPDSPGERGIWAARIEEGSREEMDRRARNAVLGGSTGYEQDLQVRGANGETRWLHETVEIRPLATGQWELVGMLFDVSRLKSVEASLQRSELQFRSVWEQSRDAMRLTDRDGTVVAVNQAFCAMVEMDELDLVGRPLDLILAEGEDRAGALERYRRRLEKNLEGERCFERQVKLRSGKVAHLEWSMTLIQEAGNDQLCLTIFRDTTRRVKAEQALRRSEAFFRSIWKGSSDGMRLTDAEGIILAVNDAFCAIVELAREELVGRPFWWAYDTGETEAHILANYRRRCRERNFGVRHLARVTLRSGEVRHLDLSLSETEGDGEKRSFLTMFRDVTRNREEEERRLKLERKMLDAQRLESLGILAGGIAHDFNNLLTAILGNASLTMMQLPESSPLRPFLEGIEKTSLQAADLCKQMLAYSGHGKVEFRPFSINTLLEEMSHLLHVSINKQIVLRSRLTPELPPIKAEPSEIQQVIMNLVINASEAIGNRSGVITLTTGLVRADRPYLEETFLAPGLPEGDYVTIEVADTGSGMTPEIQARIFDPFFTTKFTGRGLGLAAVLGILQRHKAAFKVYSEPSQGTTFKVLLPAVDVQIDEPRESAPVLNWCAAGKRILVVDDEQSVRAVAGRMLEKFGMTVLLAKDGSEGVEIFRRHKDELDLVLLDVTMPRMGGDEAFRQIRCLKPDAKVILMSGYTEADATDSFAGKGLAGFIQKPFKWEQLGAKLQEVLGEPEKEA